VITARPTLTATVEALSERYADVAATTREGIAAT
jgi:hypothetical protein